MSSKIKYYLHFLHLRYF